jgi:chaperone BCS1
MVRLYFGPNIEFSDTARAACQYAQYKLGLYDCHIEKYNAASKEIIMSVYSGTWTVDDVTMHISIKDGQMNDSGVFSRPISGSFTAQSIKHIENFLQSAHEHVEKIKNCQYGYINIFSFDCNWDISNSVKKRSRDTLKLPDKSICNFFDDLEHFSNEKTIKVYESLGIPHNRAYMLYGPPGTGKTSLIHCVASQLNMAMAPFTIKSDMKESYLRRAIKNLPKNAIFILEDIDCLISEKCNFTLRGILNMLDDVTHLKENCILFATTHHIEKIDPALKSRFDYFVEFDYCTKKQIIDIVKMIRPDENIDETITNLKISPSNLQKFLLQKKPIELLQNEYNILEENTHSMYK